MCERLVFIADVYKVCVFDMMSVISAVSVFGLLIFIATFEADL